MKKTLFISILILISSCQSEQERITSIFNESEIIIEMNTCGCFGCYESNLMFDSYSAKDDQITVTGSELSNYKKITNEKLISIENLFLDFLESTSTLRGCTGSTEFKIKGEELEVIVFENGCSLESSIYEILK